jgi:hypothetical protein
MNGRRAFGSATLRKQGDLSRRLCLRRMCTIRPGNSECVGGNVADLLSSKRKGVLNSRGKR